MPRSTFRAGVLVAVRVAAAASLLALAAPAMASTLDVSNGGSLYLTQTQTSAATGGSGTFSNLLSNPGNYYYVDSWTAPNAGTVTGTSFGFFDDFVFTVGAGQTNSITSTISLTNPANGQTFSGISGLSVRLYSYSPQGLTTGAPTNGAIDAWSSAVSFTGGVSTVSVLSPTTLGAGTYVLEVRGTVDGSSGGNYTGTLNVSPVPLPAAFPLLVTGLGMLGGLARRRRRS